MTINKESNKLRHPGIMWWKEKKTDGKKDSCYKLDRSCHELLATNPSSYNL